MPARTLAIAFAVIAFAVIVAGILPAPPALALDPKDRAIARDAFRAAERGEWARAFGIMADVGDPLAAKTLRFLRMVEDQGPGLSDTGNLFVPFYTTKPGGSGIGLVLSRQIAEGHGGTLELENRGDGTGARARMVLPLDSQA